MQKKTYAELLKDPRWQKKRLEIMQRDNFTCQHCGCKDRSLQVHHLFYENGKNPWEYGDNSLITLCERCHEVESSSKNEAYESFCDLKNAWGKAGLSFETLCSVLSNISLFVSKYEGDESLFEQNIENNPVKQLIYDSICGTQYFSDYISAFNLGIDCSEIIKNTQPDLQDKYNLKKINRNEKL